MDGRGLGCRITGLGCATLAIFAFFALLMNFSEGTVKSAQAKRQRQDVISDLALLATAINEYAASHNGKLPPMGSPDQFKKAMYPSLIASEAQFVRLGDNAPYIPNAGLSGKPLKAIKNPESVIALREPNGGLPLKKDHPPTPLLAFLNGAVQ